MEESMINLLIVAAGGALGAAGRYAVGLLPVKTDFPLLTLLVNAAGAVIIGFLAGLFARGGLTDRRLLFWKTGGCGGFTTFSAFSLAASTAFPHSSCCTRSSSSKPSSNTALSSSVRLSRNP